MGERFTIYIRDENINEWMKKEVESGKYRSISHLCEVALQRLKEKEIKI